MSAEAHMCQAWGRESGSPTKRRDIRQRCQGKTFLFLFLAFTTIVSQGVLTMRAGVVAGAGGGVVVRLGRGRVVPPIK